MTRRQAIVLFAAAPFAALAQSNDTYSLDELLDMGQQFVAENVDEDVLAQLGDVDEEKVRALLKQLQDELDQDYVPDLATLKDTADTALRLFDSNTATEPYADWLRPRLDYFDVSGRIKDELPPVKSKPGKPTPPRPVPTVKQVRVLWAETVKQRPRPAAATEFESRLKAIFAANGVPKELFWLAEIESCFNPKARSPAGAVGMFQLMPKTAKSLGLSTFPFDERKNPEKCAAAAARHLRDLYRQFNDWPLAIAAYNAGAGRVKSKLEGKKTKTFDAIASKLPSETQMYVPKLNAVLQLREGTTLEKLAKPA
jgi:membrane-bound lytic murein transglycosylase D